MSSKPKNYCVAEAYRKYFNFWFNLAKSLNTTDDEAKDIVHNVLASLLDNPSCAFESIEHVRNYVAKGVLNRSVQSKQRGGRTRPWTELTEIQHAVQAKESGVDEELRIAAFKEALVRPPKKDFEIIKMRFFSGLQY